MESSGNEVGVGTSRKPPWAWAGGIFLLALVVRFGLVIDSGQYQNQRRYEVERVGMALATSGAFADPFQTPTGPTAHVSPGYPILLGIMFRLFGTGTNGELAKEFLGCLISALQYALLALAAPMLGMPRGVGVAAGVLGACLPLKWPTETLGDWEANAAGVFLILLAAATVKVWRDQTVTGRVGMLHGLIWGCAGLFSPAVLAAEVGLAAAGLWVGRKNLAGRLRFAGFMALGTVAALAPWGVRNWAQLGYPVLARSSLGLELYVSNNDLAASSMAENRPSSDTYHPFTNPEVAGQVQRLGEVEFNRRYRQLAVDWIRANPARFVSLTLDRVEDFWFPSYPPPIKQFLLGLLTLGGFAGVTLLWWEDKAAAIALWTVQLTFPLIYYVVQSAPRYKYPIDWIGLLATVYAVSCVARALAEDDAGAPQEAA